MKCYIKLGNMYVSYVKLNDMSACNEFVESVKFCDFEDGAVIYEEKIAKLVLEKLIKVGFANLELKEI